MPISTKIKRIQRKEVGFSLIELLVVISIIGILAALTVPSFNAFNRRQTVKQAAKQLRADLRLTQNRSVSSIDNSAWGIIFTMGSSSYQLSKFRASDDRTTWISNGGTKDVQLPKGIVVSNISGSSTTIVFKHLMGIPTLVPNIQAGNDTEITVQWESAPTITQTITISTEGNIE